MGPQQMYIREKLAEEHRQGLLHEAEQRRLMAHIPHRSNMARYTIARLGAFLITVGMWLKQVEQREENFASRRKTAGSLSGTLR